MRSAVLGHEYTRNTNILGPSLSQDAHARSREIKIALERYIRQVEPTVHADIEQDFHDNIARDYFTKYPRPKHFYLATAAGIDGDAAYSAIHPLRQSALR